jgi:hypothetical protein
MDSSYSPGYSCTLDKHGYHFRFFPNGPAIPLGAFAQVFCERGGS